jgi:hypothetical protein
MPMAYQDMYNTGGIRIALSRPPGKTKAPRKRYRNNEITACYSKNKITKRKTKIRVHESG